METKSELSFTDIKQIMSQHMKNALSVDKYEITYAKHDENKWRVNVEYSPVEGVSVGTLAEALGFKMETAAFALDSKTGAILEFQKGKLWRF